MRSIMRRSCLTAGEARSGHFARLGWADVGRLAGADDRDQSAAGTGADAARAEAGPGAGNSSKGSTTERSAEPANVKETGALSWKSYRWGMSTVWLENVLNKQPPRWLPPGYSDYGALLTAAMESASQQTGVPSDLSRWKWGENYPVEIDHPVLSQLPLIGRFTGPGRHPLSGDNYTVKAVGRNFGPSERATWNFANFDESTLNLVTGESGVFLSPYYLDQWTAWYRGSTFTFPFSTAAVEKHRSHEMTLAPQVKNQKSTVLTS